MVAAVVLAGGAGAGGLAGAPVHAQSPLSPAAPPATAPPLPNPSSDASGAYVGDVLYVHAGEQRPASRTTASTGRVFRLDAGGRAWQALAYDIEPERAYHALVGGPGVLHVVGGAAHGRTHADVDRVAAASLRPSDVSEAPQRADGAAGHRPPLAGARHWPGFRGLSFGDSQARDLPLVWSDEENVAWRHAIGGYGQSSPVVWDGIVFLTAIDGRRRETQIVEAVDAETGMLRWRHTLASSQPVEVTNFVAKGAPTPRVDAERVYYLFESGDLGALSHDGEPIWSRSLKADYGGIEGYGLGSSLAADADDETLFVLAAHDGPSYLLAVDSATGETRWKADRPATSSWTTPIVVSWSGGELVVVSIDGMVEAYDAGTGVRVWWIDGLSGNRLSSPVLAGRHIVVPSMDSRSNLALPVEHEGRMPDEQALWRGRNATASMSSPVVTGKAIYFINSRGVIRCLELGSGRSRWATRLASAAWATPIVNGDRVYVFGADGVASILAADTAEPIEMARNALTVSERVYGVAAVDGALLVRAGRELIRIGHGPGTGR